MHSAIFKGQVRHRRMAPTEHEFNYRLYMVYIDLAELDQLDQKSWLFSDRRTAVARFCREDHLGDPELPLDESVRLLVQERSGRRPEGPIRLLTHLRYFGYVFNPVSFYYCYDADDTQIEYIVAEVNNTPWKEQHCYVLEAAKAEGRSGLQRYRPAKAMHVSPFMPMDVEYDWRFRSPDDLLTVHMENHRQGSKLFDATLVLRRRELSTSMLAGTLLSFPLMTLKVIVAIHWQALRLWIKRTPFYAHPEKRPVHPAVTEEHP